MKKYIAELIGSLFVILLIVIVFNWLTNPFDIFSSSDIEGFNKYKPKTIIHDRLYKVYAANSVEPDAIILGSSRALLLATNHPAFDGYTAFNFAITSASMYEELRFLQHVNAIKKLRRVVIGLDEDFIESPRPDFSEGRLAVNADGVTNSIRYLAYLKDVFRSLLSYDALKSSFATIKKQPDRYDAYPMKFHMLDRFNGSGGQRLLSRKMESKILVTGKISAHPSCEQPRAHENRGKKVSKYFEKMLDITYQQGIELYIYFTPVHARVYEAHCYIGNWPNIEDHKRAVVRAVEEIAKKYNARPHKVWDFTGYNSITTEKLPEYGDKKKLMKWYWESVHTTREADDLVLHRIFSTSTSVPQDFGVMLTTGNIEQYLDNIHQQRAVYAKTNPDDISEVRSLSR